MNFRTKVQFGLIILLIVFIISLILSQTASPDFPQVFALKRVQEKAYLKLKSNPRDKLDYMRSLLDKRLEEINSQVNRKSYNYILPSSLRYSTLAGRITEMIIANNMKDQFASTINQFNNHQKVLYKTFLIYPKDSNDNVEYKYIEDDINYLKLYLDKLTGI